LSRGAIAPSTRPFLVGWTGRFPRAGSERGVVPNGLLLLAGCGVCTISGAFSHSLGRGQGILLPPSCYRVYGSGPSLLPLVSQDQGRKAVIGERGVSKDDPPASIHA